MKKNRGYVLILNLILISLLGLFIPLLIQQHHLNFKITEHRIADARYREAAAAGLEYQLYFLKEESLLLEKEVDLTQELKIKIKGEEGDNIYFFKSYAGKEDEYVSEMKVDKEDLSIISQKNYRSD